MEWIFMQFMTVNSLSIKKILTKELFEVFVAINVSILCMRKIFIREYVLYSIPRIKQQKRADLDVVIGKLHVFVKSLDKFCRKSKVFILILTNYLLNQNAPNWRAAPNGLIGRTTGGQNAQIVRQTAQSGHTV